MATTFPTTIDAYTTKTNNVDTIAAGHVNDLQDAMVQVETILGAASTRRTSWTPSFAWASPSASSWVYTTRAGYYAQFGSIVYLSAFITATPTIGGASGQLFITGLPVVPTSPIANNFQPIAISNCSGFTTYPTNGLIWNTATEIRLYRSTNVADSLTTAHVTGGTAIQLLFSGFYFHA